MIKDDIETEGWIGHRGSASSKDEGGMVGRSNQSNEPALLTARSMSGVEAAAGTVAAEASLEVMAERQLRHLFIDVLVEKGFIVKLVPWRARRKMLIFISTPMHALMHVPLSKMLCHFYIVSMCAHACGRFQDGSLCCLISVRLCEYLGSRPTLLACV
jgi:hypothetical protein